MPQTPSQEDVIESFVEVALSRLFTALPGRIEAYDAVDQRATVQPLVNDKYANEAGLVIKEKLPVIQNVPVVFPAFGPFVFIGPLAKGDKVLLIWAKSSLDQWKEGGGLHAWPTDARHHDIADAIAIPGLRDFPHSHQPVVGKDFARIGSETGPYIAFRTDKVCLGHENVTKSVARVGDEVAFNWAKVQTALDQRYMQTGSAVDLPGAAVGKDALIIEGSPTVFVE